MKYLLIIAVVAAFSVLPNVSFAQESQNSVKEYSVQILLADEHLDLENKKFKGVTEISEEICEGPFKYKYTTGNTKTFREAAEIRLKMIEAGFTDAFVVLYGNGKRLLPKYNTETACIKQAVVARNAVTTATPDKTSVTPKRKRQRRPITESESIGYNTIPKGEASPAGISTAQTESPTTVTESKTTQVESTVMPAVAQNNSVEQIAPQFPYGEDSLSSFVKYNLLYPYPPIDKNNPATVMVSFTVDTKGNVMNPQVVNGLNQKLDAEALRVVKQMPAWTPATTCGLTVSKECVMKIDFHSPEFEVKNTPMNPLFLEPIGKK